MHDAPAFVNGSQLIAEGFTGKNTVVAIIDSGFESEHPAFAKNVIGKRRMRDGSEDVSGASHGTSVASVVTSMAPDVKLLLLNTAIDYGINGAGLVAEAVDYARQWRGPNGEKVSIINMSFGTYASLLVMRDAIKRAYNILCIAAVGNDGDGNPNTDEKAYPAAWPEVLAVGAHGVDLNARYSSNSNEEVDLVAPGQNIKVAIGGGAYSTGSGTSIAAPVVAGAAALLRERLTQRLGREPTALELRYEVLGNTTLEGMSGDLDPRLVGVGRLYLNGGDEVSRTAFINTVAPIAVKVRVDGGVLFPSVSIAQMILETGGKIHSWNNLVGYKVGSGKQTPYWGGKSVNTKTWEVYDGVKHENVSADFRAYDSIEYCLKDQALLFLNNSRYKPVVNAKTPGIQASALQECGYATDPQYPGKLMAIIRSHGLEIFDQEAKDAMERLAQLEAKIDELNKNLGLVTRSVGANAEAILKLNNKHGMEIPKWALHAVNAAVAKGIIDTPNNGSEDFYRFVTIMHRLGLFE